MSLVRHRVFFFRYNRNLVDAFKAGVKRGIATGLGMGFFNFIIFAANGLAYWYGAKLIRGDLVACCNECFNSFNLSGFGNNCETNVLMNVSDAQLQAFFRVCPCDNQEYSPGVMVSVRNLHKNLHEIAANFVSYIRLLYRVFDRLKFNS